MSYRYLADEPWITRSFKTGMLNADNRSFSRRSIDHALTRDYVYPLLYSLYKGKKVRIRYGIDQTMENGLTYIVGTDYEQVPAASFGIWATSKSWRQYWDGTYAWGRWHISANRDVMDCSLYDDSALLDASDVTPESAQAMLINQQALVLYGAMFKKMRQTSVDHTRFRRTWGTAYNRTVNVANNLRIMLMYLAQGMAALPFLFDDCHGPTVAIASEEEFIEEFRNRFRAKWNTELGGIMSQEIGTEAVSYTTSMYSSYSQHCQECGLTPTARLIYANYNQHMAEVRENWMNQNDMISSVSGYWANLSEYDEDYDEWDHSQEDWDNLIHWYNGTHSGQMCYGCFGRAGMRFCVSHDGFYSASRRGSEAGDTCSECRADPNSRSFRHQMRNYSFRPEWQFFSADHEPDEPRQGILFMGMEVETEFRGNSWSSSYETMMKELLEGVDEQFIFGKSDASINNGVELVTHPFTFDWAQENFPYDGFDKLNADWGAYESHRNTGCHVHVAKASFSPSHMWKFLAMHEHFVEVLGMYGRRGTSHGYGNLHDSISLIKQAKFKSQYAKGNTAYLNTGGRTGLNLSRSDTIEIRYPAGASSGYLLKVNTQFIQALFDFSRDLRSKHIRNGVLRDSGYWVGYLNDHEDRYPELVEFQKTLFPEAKSLETL